MSELTREKVLEMEPGRMLDYFVAVKVIGEQPWGPFDPSTDISTAFDVVEKMHKKGYAMQLMHVVDGKYFAAFSGEIYREHLADTAPEAICKAALLAVLEATP